MQSILSVSHLQRWAFLRITLLITFAGLFSAPAAHAQIVDVAPQTRSERFPIAFWWGYERVAAIYTAAELGTTTEGFTIEQIGWFSNLSFGWYNGPIRIFLKPVGGTTSQTATTWANKLTGATLVYDGTSQMNTNGWNMHALTPFFLDAGENLEVLVETNFGGAGNGGGGDQNDLQSSTTPTATYQTWTGDNTPPTGNGLTLSQDRPNIRIAYVASDEPVIGYAPIPNQTETPGFLFSDVTITDPDGVVTTTGFAPRVYYKRTTDPNVWNDNTSGTAGWKYDETPDGSSPFSFYIDFARLQGGSVDLGDEIEYFVIAEDNLNFVGINAATLATAPSNVQLSAAHFPATDVANSFSITSAFCDSPSLSIPDNNATGVVANLFVSGGPSSLSASFGLAEVYVNIPHTWPSDLILRLRAPDNTEVELANLEGSGSGDGFLDTRFRMDAATSISDANSPFTGTFRPSGNFGLINNGQSADGTWQLIASDNAAGDVGVIEDWCVVFEPNAPGPPPPAGDNPHNAAVVTSNPACTPETFSFVGLGSSDVPRAECLTQVPFEAWLKTVVPPTGGMRISVDSPMDDLDFAVYKGANSASLELITCDDNAGAGLHPALTLHGLTPGDTIWVQVVPFADEPRGEFTFCVEERSCPGGGLSGEYFIPGDYPDLTAAVNDLSLVGVCDTVYFTLISDFYDVSGPGGISIPFISGATPTSPVIFRSQSGDPGNCTIRRVTTGGGGGNRDSYLLQLVDAENIYFQNISFDRTGGNANRNILRLRENIMRCEFKGCMFQINSSTNDIAWQHIVRYENEAGSWGNYVKFQDCEFAGGSSSIFWNAASLSIGNVVENCTFNSHFNVAIDLNSTINSIVRNNTVWSNNAVEGISLIGGGYATVSGNKIEVEGVQFGLYFGTMGGSVITPSRVFNNAVMLNAGADFALTISNCTNMEVLNNTVHIANANAASRALSYLTGNTNITIGNNSFTTTGGGYAYHAADRTGIVYSDYNNIWSSTAPIARTNVDINTIAAWRTATGFDANSVSVDPLFPSWFNPEPGNAQLGGAGDPQFLAQVPRDINQNGRSNPPDIGAVQFSQICNPKSSIVYVNAAATGANDGTSWANAHPELADALLGVCEPVEVWVAAGTYLPDWNGTAHDMDASRRFVLAEDLVLLGGFDGTETEAHQRDPETNITVLSGDLANNDDELANMNENSRRVVEVIDAPNVRIDGFTIRGGWPGGATNMDRSGTAVFVLNSDNFRLENCKIRFNRSNTNEIEYGGVVCLRESDSALVRGCEFFKNLGQSSTGALFLKECQGARVESSQFIENQAISGFGGAIAAANYVRLDVRNCEFTQNSSGIQLAPACVFTAADSTFVEGCTLQQNQGYASGLYFFQANYSKVTGSDFIGNMSNGQGGGIFYNQGTIAAEIDRCRFLGNSSDTQGGGVCMANGATGSTLNIQNSLFSGNTANAGGGGLAGQGNGSMFITNCTFYRNIANNNSEGTYQGGGIFRTTGGFNFTNNILWENQLTPGDFTGLGSQVSSFVGTNEYNILSVGGSGTNSNANPLFIDPLGPDGIVGTIDDNLRIEATSPAVGFAQHPTATLVDLDSLPRGQCVADAGAYEADLTVLYPPGELQWVGCSADWFTLENWVGYVLPNTSSVVVIPGGRPYNPIINSGTAECLSLDIDVDGGAELQINVDAGAQLEIHQP